MEQQLFVLYLYQEKNYPMAQDACLYFQSWRIMVLLLVSYFYTLFVSCMRQSCFCTRFAHKRSFLCILVTVPSGKHSYANDVDLGQAHYGWPKLKTQYLHWHMICLTQSPYLYISCRYNIYHFQAVSLLVFSCTGAHFQTRLDFLVE